MIRNIAIATVLGASVAYLTHLYFIDAPGDTSAGHPHPGNNTEPELPAATSHYEPKPAPIANNGTEVVLGLRVRRDRNCRVELKDNVTTEGAMFSAYSCTPINPAPPHIYAEYDNETLATMAYADADAAALLGRRLIDRDVGKSYQLLLRASALAGGKLEHIAWLSDQAFGAVAINGEPQVDNLKRQYELAALAIRLGDVPGRTNYLRNELFRIGVGKDQLKILDMRVDALLRSMRDIQRTVLGEVTIGEQDDA
jgi:hypothetical protein